MNRRVIGNRRAIGAALAFSLLGATSALAQHDEHGPPGGAHGAPGGAPHAGPAPGAPHGGGGPPGFAHAPHGFAPQGSGAAGGGGYRGAPGPRVGYTGGAGGAPHGFEGGARGPGAGPGAGGRPSYDRRQFPSVVRPERRYHWRGQAWYPPQGYYDRRWAYGERLPWGWFGPQWYIDDYYDYDLPLPPYGYEWVRVGPDALLVDVRTGMVVESVYGLFW
jgi:hypothetical protein